MVGKFLGLIHLHVFNPTLVDIRAEDMHYDTIAKKLKLTDGVVATYE